ncbi:hypothetical protein [Streptomyces sp. NBC_00029]|uniref:phosphoketolase family protein n=1 Tax=Streptomyces sp. NBC_00029 TaxID=2903613 RepID=UPI00387065E6
MCPGGRAPPGRRAVRERRPSAAASAAARARRARRGRSRPAKPRPGQCDRRRRAVPLRLASAEHDALFTTDRPVVFAYHGYPWLIHRLVMDVIDRVPGLAGRAEALRRAMADRRIRHHGWIREHGTGLPEAADWSWPY